MKEVSQKERIQLLDEARVLLNNVKEEIENQLHDAEVILRDIDRMYGTSLFKRAESYWLAHIKEALGNGSFSMCSLSDTIQEVNDLHSGEMSKIKV